MGYMKKGIGYRVSGIGNPEREPGAMDVLLAVGTKVLGAAGDLGCEVCVFNWSGNSQFQSFLFFIPLDSDLVLRNRPIGIADPMNGYFAVVKGQIRLIYITYGSAFYNMLRLFRFKFVDDFTPGKSICAPGICSILKHEKAQGYRASRIVYRVSCFGCVVGLHGLERVVVNPWSKAVC